MKKFQADFIFPVSSVPIKNGIIGCEDDGTILEVIDPAHVKYSLQDVETFSGILCPGFVNAHCHLELSHLRGMISEKKGMASFISELLQHRFKIPVEEQQHFFEEAEKEMLRNGIVAVGDISNSRSTLSIKQKGNLYYHTFVEVLGLDPILAEAKFEEGKTLQQQFKNIPNGNASVVPHAPYTVSIELLKLIDACASENNLPVCIHMQESQTEIDFCMNHSGALAELFTNLKFNFSYSHSTGFRPIRQTLIHLPKKNNVALVHNTYTVLDEIKWANDLHKNLFWCLCPNANLYIENRLPDIMDFVNENSTIVIGTDSLASNHQLSVLEELKAITNAFTEINLETLLSWSTINGAKFLGIENSYGSFDKGKKPAIVLLENLDLEKLSLTKNTSAKRII